MKVGDSKIKFFRRNTEYFCLVAPPASTKISCIETEMGRTFEEVSLVSKLVTLIQPPVIFPHVFFMSQTL